MYLSSILVLGVRGFGALAGILVTIAATRVLSVGDAGLFLMCITIIQVFGAILCLGTYTASIKISASVTQDTWQSLNTDKASFIGLIIKAYASIFLILFFTHLTFDFNYGAAGPYIAMPFLLVGIMLHSLIILFSSSWQGLGNVFFASLLQNAIVPLLFLVMLVFFVLADKELSSNDLINYYISALFFGFLLSSIPWYRQSNAKFSLSFHVRKNLHTSLRLFAVIVSMNLLVTWGGQFAVAALLSAEEIALFNTALRTATLLTITLIAVNFVTAPEFAAAKGDIARIRNASRKAVVVSLSLATPFLLIILAFPNYLLAVFGETYLQAQDILIILSIAQFINVTSGPAGNILNMTGHEADLMKALLFSGFIAICLAISLTVVYGLLGSAIGVMLSIVIQNALTNIFVKKRLGFFPVLLVFSKA